MVNTEFNTIIELIQAFPDEQTCIDRLESLRWPNGAIASPFDASSKVYKCANKRYRCKSTAKYFNVKTATLFDNTKVRLQKWFLAIWLITSHKKTFPAFSYPKILALRKKQHGSCFTASAIALASTMTTIQQ